MQIKKISDLSVVTVFLENTFSSPTHWPEWNQVVSRYHSTDFYYLGCYEDGDLTGICPIHETRTGRLSKLFSGQFNYIPYGGWLMKEGSAGKNIEFPLKRNQSVTVYSLPEFPFYSQQVVNPQSDERFVTLIIDLLKPEEDILSSDIDSKRRNMIRKAEKNGVVIRGMEKSGLPSFYDHYLSFTGKTGLKAVPQDMLSGLLFETENIHFKVLAAYQNEVFMGSVILVYDKDYALYWMGINAKEAQNLGQGELLQWESIRFLKSAGCRIYDLCYVEKTRLPAIYEFKKGFSKTEVSIHQYSRAGSLYKVINRLSKWKVL